MATSKAGFQAIQEFIAHVKTSPALQNEIKINKIGNEKIISLAKESNYEFTIEDLQNYLKLFGEWNLVKDLELSDQELDDSGFISYLNSGGTFCSSTGASCPDK